MMDDFSDKMKRVHRLLSVSRCFAAKGIEKNDNPVWIAETFAMLLDLIQEAFDEERALIVTEPKPNPPKTAAA